MVASGAMVILFYGLDGFLNFSLWNSSFIYSLKVLNFYHMQDSGLDDMGEHGHDIFYFNVWSYSSTH